MKKLFKTSLLFLLVCFLFSCKQNIDVSKKTDTLSPSNSNELCYITISASTSSNQDSRQAGSYGETIDWNDVNKIVIKYTDSLNVVKELKTWTSDINKSARIKMESDTNIILEAGTYTFNIELYDQDEMVARGVILDKEIVSGNNHLAFSVYLDNKGSTTPITLNFDWNCNTNNLSKAVLGLYYLENQNELVEGFQKEELTIDNNSASFTKEDFPCGNFILKIELFDNIGNKAFSYVDLLIVNKAQTTINISFGNINGYTSVSFDDVEELEFTDSSYILPEFKNTAEVLVLPVYVDIKNPPKNKILTGWYDKNNPDKLYTVIQKNETKGLTLCPKWEDKGDLLTKNEIFLAASELGDYLSSTEYNSEYTVHITDKSPDLADIKSTLSSKGKYIYISFKYCTDLRVFPDTFNNNTYIKSVTLPDAVSTIQDKAFYNCANLCKAIFPESDIKFGKHIFENCGTINPNYVRLPEQLTELPEGLYYGCINLPDVIIPDNIEKIGDYCFYISGNSSYGLASITFSENSKLKEIGDSAFGGCKRLTSIDIPDSVTTIGDNAFQYCYALTSVSLPDNLTAINDCTFNSCSALSELTIPNSVTELGSEFITGTKISELSIPESVNKIANLCFSKCSNLTHIELPSAVEEIPKSAFEGCSNLETVQISPNTRLIDSLAFSGNTKLKELKSSASDEDGVITIPASVANLGESTFEGCNAITKVQINSSLYSLPNKIFNNCKSLASVNIPDTVESIGDNAFCYTAITEIQIPDSVTEIGASCFQNCKSLTSLKLPPQLKAIKNKTFNGCSAITNVDIPDTIESLGQYCFQGCKLLSAIDLPDSLTSIGDYALYGNYFTEFNFPSELTNIGNYAFAESKNLTSLTVSDNVSELGENAFYNCSALTSLDLSKTKIETIKKYIIRYSNKLETLVFPDNLKTIVSEAFYNNSNNRDHIMPALKDIVLPDSVETIGYKAFYYTLLETITTKPSPNFSAENIKGAGLNNYCFQGSKLKSIVIPRAIKSIPTNTFYGASSLESVTIPDTLTSINANAFEDITSLKEVKVSYSGTGTEDCVIGDNAFSGCTGLTTVTLPSCTTEIGENAFYKRNYNCKALTSVTVSDPTRGKNGCNVKTKCFYDCTSLTTIDLPESLDQIGSSAFNTSSETTHVPITSITISDNMKEIGASAFKRCNLLKEVIIKNKGEVSITNECSIGGSAFYECSALTRMDMPSSVTTIGNSTFYNDSLLEGISFPEGLISIGESAFDGCKTLGEITFPEGLISIGNYAFESCKTLGEITFPDSLQTIGARAFYYSNLSNGEIIIPNNVTTIGLYAFAGCKAPCIVIPDSVTSMGVRAFENIELIDYHGNLSGAPWGAKNKTQITEGDIIEESTCITKGKRKGVCSRCGDIIINLDMIAHDIDENSLSCRMCDKKFTIQLYTWIQQNDIYNILDGYKWKSKKIGDSESTSTSWTITIPTTYNYSFLVEVSSEGSYDKFTVKLDNEILVDKISGIQSKTFEVTLTAGTHTIEATYEKDSSTSKNDDCGYITLRPVYDYLPID